jgi:hypothetical protein
MSDWLTKQLEGQPYVSDGGFTERVLGALPPPERRMSSRVRVGVLVACGVVATSLAIFALGAGSFVTHALAQLVSFRGTQGAALPLAGIGLVLLIAGGAIAATTES